jgi:putative oxidoreductase
MKQFIFKTNNDWLGVILRLTIGIIMLPHGSQKVLGIFGGYGFSGTMDFFTGTKHLPALVGFMVIITEFFGSISLILGFATRFWAIMMLILMTGIILSSHIEYGFFMNWFGNQKGEGFEFHLLIMGLAAATLINGSGKLSIDKTIMSPKKPQQPLF